MRLISYFKVFNFTWILFGFILNGQSGKTDTQSALENLPSQEKPPEPKKVDGIEELFSFGPDTNLIRVLKEIRDLSNAGKTSEAQKMATAALEKSKKVKKIVFTLIK